MNTMDQCDLRQRSNRSLRRLPEIHGGITLLSIDNSDLFLSSINNLKNVKLIDFYNNCNIIHYKSLSKCLKYMKHTRSYERIIILLAIHEYDDKLHIETLGRMHQYNQIRSIMIVDRTNQINLKPKLEKLVGIYNDYIIAFKHLQKLINDADELEDGSFSTCNQKEKSLKDINQNFIQFLSIHSYRSNLFSFK